MTKTAERRPAGEAGGVQDGGEHVTISVAAAQLRRRREAAWRLPPLGDWHRDPFDALPGQLPPSDYSLTHAELSAHVRQLRRDGWQPWEIATRFDFGEAA